jgi:hypothetical protein
MDKIELHGRDEMGKGDERGVWGVLGNMDVY